MTKKHGKSHFGYKLSISVDKQNKFIRKIATGTASTHNNQHFDKVFDPANTSRAVSADRGHPSAEREAWLKENGFRNQIQRNKPPVRVPAAAQQTHSQDAGEGRACVCRYRIDGRQAATHHRPGAGELCDDTDGYLLQPEAAGICPEGWDRSLLTPEIG